MRHQDGLVTFDTQTCPLITWEGQQGYADASDLGFPVGVWPDMFETDVDGKHQVFRRVAITNRTFSGAVYSSGDLRVRVFND